MEEERYDTRCNFNVRSKADMSQLNLSKNLFYILVALPVSDQWPTCIHMYRCIADKYASELCDQCCWKIVIHLLVLNVSLKLEATQKFFFSALYRMYLHESCRNLAICSALFASYALLDFFWLWLLNAQCIQIVIVICILSFCCFVLNINVYYCIMSLKYL